MNAYRALADNFRDYADVGGISIPLWRKDKRPWAAEPEVSPELNNKAAKSVEIAHEAIRFAGLDKVAVRRFDVQESAKRIPPKSILYAHLQSEWSSSYGKLKELKTGKKSGLTESDDELLETISRNPIGF